MNEDQAIEKAMALLKQKPTTVETGKALEDLGPYISADKFGNLWEAFIVSTPTETLIEFNNQYHSA